MQGIEILIKVVVCFAVFLKLNEFHVEVMSLDNIRQRYFDVICDRFSLISNVQMDKHFFSEQVIVVVNCYNSHTKFIHLRN